MKKTMSIILVLTLLLILTGCTKSDFTLSQNEVISDIVGLTNEEITTKYEGKTIEYTAIVWQVSSNLIFEGVSLYGGVGCVINPDSLEETVVPHVKVTVFGTAQVEENNIINLNDCEIKKVHTSIDNELEASDYNIDALSNQTLYVFQISGEVHSVFGNVIQLVVSENENLSIPFKDGFDLSSYTQGNQVTINAVWDGEFFNGYEIE